MDDFSKIAEEWKKTNSLISCDSGQCSAKGFCKYYQSALNSIKIRFLTNYWYIIPPSEYLIDGSELGQDGICVFGVNGNSNLTDDYIFGQLFLRNFYTVLDYQYAKIGFGSSINSSASIEEDSNYWFWLILVIGFLVAGGGFGYWCYKKRNPY